MDNFTLSCYKEIMNADDITQVGETILIPKFSKELLEKIINSAVTRLKEEKPLIKRNGSFVIVGDIHGNLHDLLRIFKIHGYPPEQRYIFLGDYVDRGEFSIDVITMLFVFLNSFPDHITLLRGNHEFIDTNTHYGFRDECSERFGNDAIFNLFNEAFCYIPMACILNNEIFCVHGGITPNFNRLEDLESINFPIQSPNVIIYDMVWSDPSKFDPAFTSNPRGVGKMYGFEAVMNFLDKLKLKVIIRAHQCVDGYSVIFNKRLITVFSSSNYADGLKNSCGVIIVTPDGNLKPIRYTAIDRVRSKDCSFITISEPNERIRKSACEFSFRSRSLNPFGQKNTRTSPKSLIARNANRNVQLRSLIVHANYEYILK